MGISAVKYQVPEEAVPTFAISKVTSARSFGDVGYRAKMSPLMGSITP